MQVTPYALPLLVSAVVCSVMAVYMWDRRAIPGARMFVALMGSVALWALFSLLELVSNTYSTREFWHLVKNAPLLLAPVGWMGFAAGFTRRPRWTSLRALLFFSALPLLTLLCLLAEPTRRLVFTGFTLRIETLPPYIQEEYGPLYWINLVYAYGLILLGSVYLIQWRDHAPRWFGGHAVLLASAILLPWAGHSLDVFRLNPLPFLDLGPITFTLSGMLIAWGIFRFQLLDLLPIARTVVVENMQDGVIVFDDQARVVDLNPSAAALLGLQPSEALGQPYHVALARFPLAVETYASDQERRLQTTEGEGEQQRYFDLRIAPLYEPRSRQAGKLVEVREVTDHKQAEQELEKSHALLLATLEATADGILVISGRGKSLRFNKKFIEMWRVPAEAIKRDSEQEILAFIVDQLANPAAFYRLINKLSTTPDAESYDVLELKDGRVFERYSRPQRINEKRVGRVWSFRDVTEQRHSEERLRWMSTHDILTGLYNRVYFEEEINRLEKGRQYPIAVIVGDVDGLKETNDLHGHQAGDALLVKAADILRQACRAEDMVARIGGDEFGILLPFSDASVAENAIERIRNIQTMTQVGEGEPAISLSLGAATAVNGDSLRKVIRQADEAMYRVKSSRRSKRQG